MFKSTMIGNLCADPEVRHTTNGTTVAEVRLACDTGKDGVSYVNLVFWDKDAELVAQYLKKGRKIYAECRVTTDEWTDKESGKKKSKHIYTCEYFKFLTNPQRKDNDE